MNTEYETTRSSYAHLEYTETCYRQAVEALAEHDPEMDDRAELIRDLYGCRDRAHLARVEAARATGFLSLACDEHGATLSDVVNRFSRRLVMSAPPKPATPEFWEPEAGDVWVTRHGWTWTLEGDVMVSRDTGGEPCVVEVAVFRGEDPVLWMRGGGFALWVPALRERFPVGARVVGPMGERATVTVPPEDEVRPGTVGAWWPSGGRLEGSHVWVVVDGEDRGVWAPTAFLG